MSVAVRGAAAGCSRRTQLTCSGARPMISVARSRSSASTWRLRCDGGVTPTASKPAFVRQLIGSPSIDIVPAVAISTWGRWALSTAPAITERVALPVQRMRMFGAGPWAPASMAASPPSGPARTSGKDVG